MPSKQSHAVKTLYQSWTAARAASPPPSPEEQRESNEHWGDLTAEPGSVDYVETNAGGVPAMWAVPKGCVADRVLLCLHGGGFVGGSMYTHRKLFAHLARAVGARALLLNYRLLPQGVYPAPIDDALAAYRWLLEQGISANHIAFTGDSAGGWLSITTQLHARNQGLPLPVAAMLLSPWVDFEVSGETMLSNSEKDALFSSPYVKQLAKMFLAGTDPRDPYANPLYADLTSLGPISIQVGDDELLLDDSRRLARYAEKAGVAVRLDIFAEMQHTFQMMVGRAPEADDAICRLAEWVRPILGLGV